MAGEVEGPDRPGPRVEPRRDVVGRALAEPVQEQQRAPVAVPQVVQRERHPVVDELGDRASSLADEEVEHAAPATASRPLDVHEVAGSSRVSNRPPAAGRARPVRLGAPAHLLGSGRARRGTASPARASAAASTRAATARSRRSASTGRSSSATRRRPGGRRPSRGSAATRATGGGSSAPGARRARRACPACGCGPAVRRRWSSQPASSSAIIFVRSWSATSGMRLVDGRPSRLTRWLTRSAGRRRAGS